MEHNKKIRKQLRGYSQYESIKKVLQNNVYDSLIVEDFEARWARIVSEYYLVVNERLRGLYKELMSSCLCKKECTQLGRVKG